MISQDCLHVWHSHFTNCHLFHLILGSFVSNCSAGLCATAQPHFVVTSSAALWASGTSRAAPRCTTARTLHPVSRPALSSAKLRAECVDSCGTTSNASPPVIADLAGQNSSVLAATGCQVLQSLIPKRSTALLCNSHDVTLQNKHSITMFMSENWRGNCKHHQTTEITSSHAVPHSALPSQLKPLQLPLPSWQIPALPLKRLVAARPRGEGSQHHKTRRSHGISVISMDLWSVMKNHQRAGCGPCQNVSNCSGFLNACFKGLQLAQQITTV